MLIGEIAQRTGTTTKTLRFYEDAKLLPAPQRTPAGYRDYSPDVVDRIAFIHDAQKAGFTLRQVGQILDIRDGGESPCVHVGHLVHQRLEEVEQRITELEHTRDRLAALARRTRELDPADCGGYCTIIEAT
ncbi:heavy metal-responsive transcriptional regulator [Actinobacteria bacterium YIM 96077]|uniref:Heavy metal-responsive transcriptional regulator n=1 Tax=Phytoactinopolyspora halophila TaxID=1981511 RepID=A0A329QB53_9ACTN|nr:heavy metal-responsive transcriptional regulator [Phytoactinopolyspora halophila]AYY13736.1 heavy metal-responsive transcriptional regulator [Actinobacteria bacterium YIM 96077]RAW09467.1 heavy metal-responsive transcriptional regulator [Phytoactinopolyspora halophila]